MLLFKNREHLAYYAKALGPGINIWFIISAYNATTNKKEKMIKYDDEIITKVYSRDFLVTATIADNEAAK